MIQVGPRSALNKGYVEAAVGDLKGARTSAEVLADLIRAKKGGRGRLSQADVESVLNRECGHLAERLQGYARFALMAMVASE